jgi:hypothetical protein
MSNVLVWSLAGSLMVFAIGLVSAIESRRQSRTKSHSETMGYVAEAKKGAEHTTAMSMAAGSGTGNISISGSEGSHRAATSSTTS